MSKFVSWPNERVHLLFAIAPFIGLLAAIGFVLFAIGNVDNKSTLPSLSNGHDPQSNQVLSVVDSSEANREVVDGDSSKPTPARKIRLEKLSFDPVEAKQFDQIASKLKLTDEELQVFKRNGFVSVDHKQKYSFGSAYYQIYSAHLPVFVTTDSILHAMHRSFDDLLAELELVSIIPQLESILAKTHQSLGRQPAATGKLQDNFRDVDLYLTVARNVLHNPVYSSKTKTPVSIRFPSVFDQDDEVRKILGLIAEARIQIPDREGTVVYGGRRAIDFSQFKPRGHYTKHPSLKAYFKCMMWLSRADCGWIVQPVDPVIGIKCNPTRELKNSSLLVLCLKNSNKFEPFATLRKLLSHFAGQDDHLSVEILAGVLAEAGIKQIADLENDQALSEVDRIIRNRKLGAQKIRSQAILGQGKSTTVQPPVLFQMFGQKFVIDSFVMSQVVYDSIIFENRKIKRFMPMGLDVMAALGNDEALSLLQPELAKYHYAANLHEVTQFVDQQPGEFWQQDLYNVWLDAIRELDDGFADTEKIPEVMQTTAWQRKQLQTQLASWSELRHDMALYAKQSYTTVPGCEYTDGYVEPYPDVYRKLRGLTERLRDALVEFDRHSTKHQGPVQTPQKFIPPDLDRLPPPNFFGDKKTQPNKDLLTPPRVIDDVTKTPKTIKKSPSGRGGIEAKRQFTPPISPAERIHKKRMAYVDRTIEILTKLEAMSEKELRGEKLSDTEVLFLQRTIDRRGSMPHGSGRKPRYDGWYCDLFYRSDEVKLWKPTIIDVHTFPNPDGTPTVLEVGVGNVNLGVFAIDGGDEPIAYVGPLYSYYEFEQPANNRLTDGQWSQMLSASTIPSTPRRKKTSPQIAELPTRPEWTNIFQPSASRRTVDKISVNISSKNIRIVFTKNNQGVKTKSFPATDNGLADFVTYLKSQKIEHRISLNLTTMKISPESVSLFKDLENLASVSLTPSQSQQSVWQRFQVDRPDVELLTETKTSPLKRYLESQRNQLPRPNLLPSRQLPPNNIFVPPRSKR